MKNLGLMGVFLGLLVAVGGCAPAVEEPAKETGQVVEAEPVDDYVADNYFAIGAVEDPALAEIFSKQVDIFGVNVVASTATPDYKVLWASNILAQYLDNNEDGTPDNQDLVDTMTENNALLIMFADFDELEESSLRGSELRDKYRMQDCEGHETNPEEGFDAAIEEVHHLIVDTGWAELYPDAFSTEKDSKISQAMDIARGGVFEMVPDEYPEGAWYSYYDETCEYDCMNTEYHYWAMSSMLGAQADPVRCEQISEEWRPCTPELVESMDPTVFALLTDPQYMMPTVLPDGSYRPTG